MSQELSNGDISETRSLILKRLIDSKKIDFGSYPEDENSRLQFGLKLRSLRGDHNFGLNQFASQVGINPGFLSRIESGKRSVSLKYLCQIADGLGASRFSLMVESGYIVINKAEIEDWELELFRLLIDK